MAVRKKPKNDFGVELMAFCATYGLTYGQYSTVKAVCQGRRPP